MFLQQQDNSNGFPPEDQLVPGKYGSNFSLEFYYCHEWGHISNDFPQITYDRVRGGNGRRGGGAYTDGISGTGLLHICVGLAQNTDEMITISWILMDTCSTSSVCIKE